ncbi:M24 family metallopeptidase [Rhizobium lusitanum]|uniref:M24 family metallopeptidase n=1 Tax=Rhizobium lusitanum TaxID=293958 RepID=A0A6L9UHT7_9HYPH|nr:Xaa-Pro peptidase family protein [Rhizobium lusitanum]NEI73686.1 M24 family metallopeptidase [Rhizobium lusitanum]
MTKTPIFSQSEFDRRRDAIQQEMQRRNVSLVLLDQPETIFHFIGYAMSEGYHQFCAVPARGNPLMVLRSVDEGTCKEFSYLPDENIVGFQDWESPTETLLAALRKKRLDVNSIGIDRNSYNLTLLRFEALQVTFGEASFTDFSDFLIAFRSEKSPEELEFLQRSSTIADDAIAELLKEIRSGFSARECVAIASKHTIRLGGDLGIVGVVTRAIDDTKMHALVDDVPLEEGALLHVELIPQFQGYSSRIMRPVYFGDAPAHLSQTADDIVSIQDRQFSAMRPGVEACEVDAIVRDGMLKAGLKDSYRNISGYSLGYYQHFTCRSSDFSYTFRPNARWRLRENMVFHMYTVGKGLAFSETVVVTKEGGKRLTQTPRRLLSVPMRRAQ